MEQFAQTNVFAWIWTVFAHLIIGCAIRYPKIGNLRYKCVVKETGSEIGYFTGFCHHHLATTSVLLSFV